MTSTGARRAIRPFAIALVFVAGCGGEPPARAPDPQGRPNVLLLVAEDLSPRIGAYGDPVAVTPNLDRLAAEGTRFTRAFTAAGVCSPSRAALVTGVHPGTLGAGHMRTSSYPGGAYKTVPPPEVKAFPELLRAEGYYTFTDAKLDYQFSGPTWGSGPSTIWNEEGLRTGWQRRPDGAPFFGMLNFMVTHESSLFERGGVPTSGGELLHMWLMRGHESLELDPAAVELPPYYPDDPLVRETLVRFYDQIHRLDEQVGEELARLEAEGLADSTIVIFTSDHGDGLPRSKREVLDSGTHVPLIVRWPDALRPADAPPGGVDDRLVSFVDFAPTILSLAGAPVPEFVQGRVFLGPEAGEPRRYVFASRDRIDETADRVRSVRDARYRYVRHFELETPASDYSEFREGLPIMQRLRELYAAGALPPSGAAWFEPRPREALYDLDADPHEIHDLSADPAHAETLARLRAALDGWLARVPDLGAIPEEELVERFAPGGVVPVTEPPTLRRLGDERVALASPSEGASIAWRQEEGPWQIYQGPFEVDAGATLEAYAVRYGWDESERLSLQVE